MAALLDIVTKGSTDRSVTIRIIDSTDGTPETGVVFNTAGIDLWYRREGAALTSITEATQTVSGAHADGGFVHIGNGEYRLDLPDAAFASGANYVDVGGTVTGMIVLGGRVRLVDVNLEDSVRAGLTALPNAAAAASGGLFTRGTGAGQINQDANGRIDVNLSAVGGSTANVAALANNIAAILVDTDTTIPGLLATIDTVVDAILADTGTDGVVVNAGGLATDAVNEIRDALLAATVETRANSSINLAAALRILIAVAAGQRSGNTYLSPDGTANRVVGTVAGGDRTAITVTTTA